MASTTFRNWSGSQVFSPARLLKPTSVAEVQAAVRSSTSLRPIGTGHSFNGAAASTADMLSFSNYTSPEMLLDDVAATLKVPACATYTAVMDFLAPTRWALHNAASLPHISVGGSVATGTHGSGVMNGNLATSVVALELVTADGELRILTQGDADFAGAVVSVGSLGVLTGITLSLVPSFLLQQTVFEDLPFQTALEHLREILATGYSVSLFTTWLRRESRTSSSDNGLWFEQVWRKCLVHAASTHPSSAVADEPGMPETWLSAKRALVAHHPIPGVDSAPCTEQLGSPGPWHSRLPHFRAEFTPSAGEELQSEYFVDAADASAALTALAGLADRIAPLLYITEIRAIAKDALWLSPAYGRDSVAIHFTWKFLQSEVLALLPAIECALAPFQARPHWGKLFTMSAADLAATYPEWYRFRELRRRLDPGGKFSSSFTDACGL
jgi:alditol oxidase